MGRPRLVNGLEMTVTDAMVEALAWERHRLRWARQYGDETGTAAIVAKQTWPSVREAEAAIMRAALAAAQAGADEWQPIETAPKDGTRFLAVAGDGGVGIVSRHDPGGEQRNPRHHYECWVTEFNSPVGSPPTHWRPLPSPPTEEKILSHDPDYQQGFAAGVEAAAKIVDRYNTKLIDDFEYCKNIDVPAAIRALRPPAAPAESDSAALAQRGGVTELGMPNRPPKRGGESWPMPDAAVQPKHKDSGRERQAHQGVTAGETAPPPLSASEPAGKLMKRPIAWRVSTKLGKWVIFQDEKEAYEFSEKTDAACTQGMYVRDGSPLMPDEWT